MLCWRFSGIFSCVFKIYLASKELKLF
uniref:Uncharacterized protein n=1 Tax=Anguilla anguilla TaxID=7936 RepID=A0A0E9W2M3_ANGAN